MYHASLALNTSPPTGGHFKGIDIGRSVAVACAMQKKDRAWICEQAGFTKSTLSQLCLKNSCNSKSIERLAKCFGYQVSFFLALGEV